MPERGSLEWEAARKRAYDRENPAWKGPLGERYPGYEDKQHAVDLAILTWMIIDGSRRSGNWKKHPEHIARNYRTYLDHCHFAGISNPESNATVLLCYHEAERQAYQEATGKLALPFKCYYDNEWGIEDIKVVLPDDAAEMIDKLYSYDRGTRLNLMRAAESKYRQWKNGGAA